MEVEIFDTIESGRRVLVVGLGISGLATAVIGAEGLRSTVRTLAFGPHETYLRRLNHMIATFELPSKLGDVAIGDGPWLMEPGRSLIVYTFKDHAPTALLTYRTEDVDAEFREPPARQAPPGRIQAPTET